MEISNIPPYQTTVQPTDLDDHPTRIETFILTGNKTASRTTTPYPQQSSKVETFVLDDGGDVTNRIRTVYHQRQKDFQNLHGIVSLKEKG